jgi:hypothetical protein
MTRSPGATWETPAPTAVTRPMHSTPGVAGNAGFRRYVPRQNEMSAGLIGNASTSKTTSPVPACRRRERQHSARDLAGRAVPIDEDGFHRFQPIQAQTARPMTSSRSRPRSHGSSSVNSVTHWRHGQGMRVMSVPQNQRAGPKAS